MALEVEVDFPDLPKGTVMDLGGLAVKNGEKTEIDEDQELAFVSRNQKALKDKVGNSPHVKVTGSPKYGPAAVEKMFPPPVVPEQPENIQEAEAATEAEETNGGEK